MDGVRVKEAIYVALVIDDPLALRACEPVTYLQDLVRCVECRLRGTATDGSLYCTHWSRKVPETGFCHLACPDPARHRRRHLRRASAMHRRCTAVRLGIPPREAATLGTVPRAVRANLGKVLQERGGEKAGQHA